MIMSKFMQCLCLLLLLPNIVLAQVWQAHSGDKQIAVLELFTSEGCGLCPAADRWVEELPHQGVTDNDVIVLGFHIDYLNDKKGWIDKYAKAKFSDRQRQLARLNLYQSVYTPEFVISGEVIHNWQKHAKDVITAVNTLIPEASIALEVEHKDDQLLVSGQVNVEGNENKQHAKLYLAVIEDNISNKVSGGDNAGTTFNHQNLVRKWVGPIDLDTSGSSNITSNLKIDTQWNLPQTSIVALVQNLDDSFVLQGLVLPLK
jgi:hypothetical protein